MPTKKSLGEPDAGDPQVRFDEGALETEPWPKRGTGMLRKQPETATPRSYSHRASALLHGISAAQAPGTDTGNENGRATLGPASSSIRSPLRNYFFAMMSLLILE